jgi:hypothetical protein
LAAWRSQEAAWLLLKLAFVHLSICAHLLLLRPNDFFPHLGGLALGFIGWLELLSCDGVF